MKNTKEPEFWQCEHMLGSKGASCPMCRGVEPKQKIERFALSNNRKAYLRLEDVPDDNFVDVTFLMNKINEIIDIINLKQKDEKTLV